ncbi:MAG: hypothetical protein RBS95_02260 [Desulfobulbus sp.]|jgi:hypothetical protein|nr:hypothetical protein [Desulfobulbus sp.]
MHKVFFPAVLALITLAVASLSIGKETSDDACPRAMQTNCTTCHDTGRICAKLDTPGADWKTTVRVMGERGNLSAEVQETVLTCLATSADSKKQLCPAQTP